VCSYAFVEFEEMKDAEDALVEMHGRNIEGSTFIIKVKYV
jgi:RNA recognition motif-containing protein